MKKYMVRTSAFIIGAIAAITFQMYLTEDLNNTTRWLNNAQPVYAQSAYKTSESTIYLNGDKLEIEQSLLVNGSTLVPLRGVFDNMGLEVKWLPATKQVHIKDKGKNVYITPGVNKANIDGKEITLSSASVIHNGKTYVPLRFISETYGYITGYDKVSKSISISTNPYEKMKVHRIIDGDTYELSKVDSKKDEILTVRLIGVNTPESTEAAGYEPWGKEASAYAKDKLLGKTVYMTLDKSNDKYGRTLAYIHLENGEFFNASLVSEGYAEVMTIEPNTQWSTYFEDLEIIAKQRKLNLWANTNDKSVAEKLLNSTKEAGLNLNVSDLSKPITNKEASSMLLYMLYPEARKLIGGYKLYQIATDENTKEIIVQLYNVTQDKQATIATGSQIRTLILSAIGLKEDSVVVGTLDAMGLLPSHDKNLTVEEMIVLVERLQAIMPTIDEIKEKAKVVEAGIKKLNESGVDLSVSGLLDGMDEHLAGLSDYISGAAGWIKDSLSSLFSKKLSTSEINQIVDDTKKAAEDIQKMLEGAYSQTH